MKMSSYNNVNGLVLTRKLNPSEKQKRKQLIAEAAKIPHSRKNRAYLSQNSFVSSKSLSCFGGKDEANSKNFSKNDRMSNSRDSSHISTIDLMDTVVWPIKTRTRIFMPFFDWYGGECSKSQRKIIIKETNRTNNTSRSCSINDSSLLGKGRFSRVIRCRIKEESRICSNATQTSKSKDSKESDVTDFVDNSDFSPEMAVKVINKSSILSDPELIQQLCQERRIHEVCSKPLNMVTTQISKYNCPTGILPLLRAWQDDLHLYMAFPLCERGTLYDIWERVSREHQDIGFSSLVILLVVYQVGTALDHIHNVGVVHRDVKMENILIGQDGNLKLMDFGLAKWLNKRQRTGTICGRCPTWLRR